MTNPHEGTAIVTGFLTLHGEAHAMTMSVHATLGADGVFAGDGEVKFNYEDFGVKVPAVLFHTILAGDEVDRSLSYRRGQRRRACAVIRLSARRSINYKLEHGGTSDFSARRKAPRRGN